MFGRWVLVQGKGIPRNIRIGRHCVLVKYTGVQEGDDLMIVKATTPGSTITPVFMVTKSCTKILIFSTRFSCQHFSVEYFVTLFMGKKSCRWGNVMFGHGFDKLV